MARKPTNQSILDNPWGEEDVAAYRSFVQRQQEEEEELRANPFAGVTSRSQFVQQEAPAPEAPARAGIMDILFSLPNPLTLPAQAVSGFRQTVEVPETREAVLSGLQSGGQRLVGQAAQVAADTRSLPLRIAAGSLANVGGNFMNLGATDQAGFQDVAGQAMGRSRVSGEQMESKLAALPNPVQREIVGAFARAYQSPASSLSAVSGFLGPQGAAIGGTIAGMDMWGGEYVNARQLNKLSVDDATEYATWKTLPAAIEFLPTGGKAGTALSSIDRGAVVLEGAKRLLKTAGAEASTEGLQTALAFGIDGVIAKYHPNAKLREVALKNLPANATAALKEIGRSAAAGAAGGVTLSTPAQGLQLAAEYGKAAADIQRTEALRKRGTAAQDRAEAEQQRVFTERAAEREAARQEQVARMQTEEAVVPLFPEEVAPLADVDTAALEREVETDIAYLQNERANIRRNSTPATLDTDFARIQEIDSEIASLRRGATGAPIEAPSSVVPDRDTTTRPMFPELAQRDADALAAQRATALTRREEAGKLLDTTAEKAQKAEDKIVEKGTQAWRKARSTFLETQQKATAQMDRDARIDAIVSATEQWEAANPVSRFIESARTTPTATKRAAPVAAPTAAPVVEEAAAPKTDAAFLDDATARLQELMGGGRPDVSAQQRVGGAREVVATTPRGEFTLRDQEAPAGTDFSEFGQVRIVEAFDGDTKIGQLVYANDGTPPTIEVNPEYQRRGVATAMLKMAQEQGGVVGEAAGGIRGRGAEYRTPAGQAFRSAADTSSVTFREAPSVTARATGAPTVDVAASQRIEQEITGKSPVELAQWAVDNAPDAAQKSIAQKVVNKLKALEKIGVRLTANITAPATPEEAATRPEVLGQVRLHLPEGSDEFFQDLTIAGTKFAEGGGVNYETILHELYHMATLATTASHNLGAVKDENVAKFMGDLATIRTQVVARLRAKVRNKQPLTAFEQAALRENNSLENEDELLAWAVSNTDMQEMLKGITINGRSAWQKFVDAIAKLFGIPTNSQEYNALERVLEIAVQAVDTDVDIAREGLENLASGRFQRTAQQSVGPSDAQRTIIDRAKAQPEKQRSEKLRQLKGALLTEWGIGGELAESLGHSRGRAGALALKANDAGNRLLKALDTATALHKRTQRLAGEAPNTQKFLLETREEIRKAIEEVDKLPDKGARDSALNALDRKYPGVGAAVREIRDMKLQLAAEIIQQHYELGRPLTQKEKATINSIIKNAERYTTRAYMATYNKSSGREYAESIMKAYKEDPTSESGKLVTDGLEWLMTEGLVVPDEATMNSMTTGRIERLYAAWVGSRKGKSKETMIKELAALPAKTQDEMYDKAMLTAKEMLGLTAKKSSFVSRYIFGENSKQNRTILEARTDIPLPLRKMMGEITDPFLREMISLQRQINLSTKSKLLIEVKKIGEKNGWVSKTETPQNNVQLNDPAYGALDGLWVSGEVLDAISGPMSTLATTEADLSDAIKSPSIMAEMLANYTIKPTEKLSRLQKTSSIVLDVAQMGLNFAGAFNNLVLNGVSNPDHMVNGMKTASYAVLEQISPKLLNREQTEALAEVTQAQSIDSATTGEFKGQAADVIRNEIEKLSREGQTNTRVVAGNLFRALRSSGHTTLQAFRATYAFMDVWVKVATYYSNKEFYTEFNRVENKGWTDEQIRRRSGWEAAGTNISYDRASPLVRTTERVLPVAMFATYFSEVFRTVGMSYVQTVRDFQLAADATTAEGKQMAAAKGLKRLIGTTLATAGIVGLTVSKLNDEDEEEEKQRNLTDAPWDREKIRLEMGKDKNGNPVYFYLNKADPNGPLNDIAITVMDKVAKKQYDDIPAALGKSVLGLFVPAKGALSVAKVMVDGAAHSLAHVTGDDKWTKADWLKQKKSGVLLDNYPEVYSKVQDTLAAGDLGENLVEAFENLFMVGTVKPWIDDRGNIVATPGNQPISKNDPRKVWAEAGLSVAPADPEKSLKFKMIEYGKAMKGIKDDKKQLLERIDRMDADQVAEEVASIVEAERDAFTTLRKHYEGYLSFDGRSPSTAMKSMDERDMKTFRAIQNGNFNPTVLSHSAIDKWYTSQLKDKSKDRKQIREEHELLNSAFVKAYRRGE